jgi:2'-5' RNA ligase
VKRAIPGKKRLFVAIDLTPEIKQHIHSAFSSQLDEKLFRPVPQTKLHSTFVYIGVKPELHVNDIIEKLATVKHAPFEISLEDIGTFHSDVIFIKIQKGAQECNELFRDISHALQMHAQRYEPHVTLARSRNQLPLRVMLEYLKKLDSIPFKEHMPVKQFHLIESLPSKEGSTYHILASFDLI